MDQNFQTSFIPKKPIVNDRATSSQPIGLFMIISLFVLFGVLLVTGGIYLYKGIIQKDLALKSSSLDIAKNSFEPSKISELQLLDKRLRAGAEVLSKHTTIIPIFKALESLTMKSVRFTKFAYTIDTEKGTKVDVKMSGQALGYRDIALQSDLFAKNKNLIDPVFSNLTLDNSGNVLFDLEFSVDPSFVNYKQALLANTPS